MIHNGFPSYLIDMILSLGRNVITKKSIRQKTFFLALLACIFLFSFFNNPEKSLLPGCYFKSLTGNDCPSCGLSRSFYEFSHLNFPKAFQFHLFGPVLFVLFLLVFLKLLIEIMLKRRVRIKMKPAIFRFGIISLFCGWIIYWLIRLV